MKEVVAHAVDQHEAEKGVAEGRHQRPEIVFEQELGRTGRQVHNANTRPPIEHLRRIRIVAAGKDIDGVAQTPQIATHLIDVHILATRIHTAEEGNRAGVLAEEGDAA